MEIKVAFATSMLIGSCLILMKFTNTSFEIHCRYLRRAVGRLPTGPTTSLLYHSRNRKNKFKNLSLFTTAFFGYDLLQRTSYVKSLHILFICFLVNRKEVKQIQENQ